MGLYRLGKRSEHLIIRFASIVLMLFTGYPATITAAPPSEIATFQYSMSSSEPIIEYTLIHSLLADQDPQPLLRIYASGHVHAHYPAFMKGSGDYEMQLNQTELRELLQSLSNDGIIDFDIDAARSNRVKLVEQQRQSSGTLFYISDATHTVIDIRLDGYQRNISSQSVSNLRKRFQWTNLEQDKKRFPDSDSIQKAANGAQKLDSLFGHSNLTKMQ